MKQNTKQNTHEHDVMQMKFIIFKTVMGIKTNFKKYQLGLHRRKIYLLLRFYYYKYLFFVIWNITFLV